MQVLSLSASLSILESFEYCALSLTYSNYRSCLTRFFISSNWKHFQRAKDGTIFSV